MILKRDYISSLFLLNTNFEVSICLGVYIVENEHKKHSLNRVRARFIISRVKSVRFYDALNIEFFPYVVRKKESIEHSINIYLKKKLRFLTNPNIGKKNVTDVLSIYI